MVWLWHWEKGDAIFIYNDGIAALVYLFGHTGVSFPGGASLKKLDNDCATIAAACLRTASLRIGSGRGERPDL
jgi:hypothetical protein